jgi:hypothetical protein
MPADIHETRENEGEIHVRRLTIETSVESIQMMCSSESGLSASKTGSEPTPSTRPKKKKQKNGEIRYGPFENRFNPDTQKYAVWG